MHFFFSRFVSRSAFFRFGPCRTRLTGLNYAHFIFVFRYVRFLLYRFLCLKAFCFVVPPFFRFVPCRKRSTALRLACVLFCFSSLP